MMSVKKGDRIELIAMPEDPNPVPRGTRGTVTHVSRVGDAFTQISVEWDNGSRLMLSCPPDRFRLVRSEA